VICFSLFQLESMIPVESKHDIGFFINRRLSDIEKNIVSTFIIDGFSHL